MTAAILACLAFWLILLTLWPVATHSGSAVYTAAIAAVLWVEVQARMGEL